MVFQIPDSSSWDRPDVILADLYGVPRQGMQRFMGGFW